MADHFHDSSDSKHESFLEKLADKIHHGGDDNDSSSDSDNDKPSLKSKIYRLFGRETPVHKLLGGGKAADVLLWRNKKISAGVLGGVTFVWSLFEVFEYHLLTFICHLLIVSLAVFFLWTNASSFINKAPPHFLDMRIPEAPVLEFASALRYEINRGIGALRDISSRRDLKKILLVITGLWLLSIIGSCCSFLTLFYIGFLLLLTLPVLYEKYEDQVDSFAEKATAELKKQYAVFDAKVLSKIPRGLLKDKKRL